MEVVLVGLKYGVVGWVFVRVFVGGFFLRPVAEVF